MWRICQALMQRSGPARTPINDPKSWILDEPANGMDNIPDECSWWNYIKKS